MQKVDLHIHTTASDGLLTPDEVVHWANKKNLRAFSITDHDTVSGVKEVLKKYKSSYSEIIPGIELNSDYYGEEIHVLGYYIDCNNKFFTDKLKEIQHFRYNRAVRMIKKLNDLGVNIDIKQIEKESVGKSIGRPHIAHILIDNGYAKNLKSAFDKYIGKNRPAYVERYKLTTKQAINMVIEAKGVPVLAHPGLIENKNLINDILNLGFKGIEVYHTKHDKETEEWLLEIASAQGLAITGGSDCHGVLINKEPILGSVFIDYQK